MTHATSSLRLAPAAVAAALKLSLAVIVALVVVAVLTGRAFGFAAPSQPAISDPTGFGSNVPEHVDTRPIERDTATANGYRLHKITCADGAAPGTTCYAASF